MKLNDKVVVISKDFWGGKFKGQIGKLIFNYPLMPEIWLIKFDSDEVCITESQIRLYKNKTRKCFKQGE